MTGLSEREWSDVLASLPENLDETAEGWELSLVRRTVERIVAARLASVEALGQDGSPDSLMEAVRAELTTYLGQGSANLATSRVMHQIRTHLAAALGSDAHTEQKGAGE